MAAKQGNRVSRLRETRKEEGWARVDLNIPPSKALRNLERLTGGDPKLRVEKIIELLERAV